MDFTLTDEQHAVEEAATGVLAGLVTPDRVEEVEATDDRIDRERPETGDAAGTEALVCATRTRSVSAGAPCNAATHANASSARVISAAAAPAAAFRKDLLNTRDNSRVIIYARILGR